MPLGHGSPEELPHDPPEQRSVPLQKSPSPQGSVLGVFTQPVAPQESVVHGLKSSHPRRTHVPPQHCSPAAHREVSLQSVPKHVAVKHPLLAHVAVLHVGYWQP